jgi:hypothetical protein
MVFLRTHSLAELPRRPFFILYKIEQFHSATANRILSKAARQGDETGNQGWALGIPAPSPFRTFDILKTGSIYSRSSEREILRAT